MSWGASRKELVVMAGGEEDLLTIPGTCKLPAGKSLAVLLGEWSWTKIILGSGCPALLTPNKTFMLHLEFPTPWPPHQTLCLPRNPRPALTSAPTPISQPQGLASIVFLPLSTSGHLFP